MERHDRHKNSSGKYTAINLQEGGDTTVILLDFAGEVTVSNASKAPVVLGLASSGGWSGGENYHGFVASKPGGIILLNRKGARTWLEFTDKGVLVHQTKPGQEAVPAL